MKVMCPKCGRTSHLDDDVGDFPMRCQRCGALLRLRGKSFYQKDLELTTSIHSTPIQRGALAGLLISRSTCEEQDPPVIHASAGRLVRSETAEGRQGILRPETRGEIKRVRARQQMLRKAELTGHRQALGALSWAGLALVALLAVGALVLKAQAM